MGRGRGEADAADAAATAGGGGFGGGSQRFLDRSKVRILLCDSDPESSHEVLHLLCNCSYQVTSVKSAREVINVLNAQGSDIDIILAEVDLPVSKGLKMLKYIARNKDLRHISIIMMSSQDEVAVVVKCLRLGAADYLVKPLRTNELLNLWTHVWRRRRMLGLPEKNFFNHDFEVVLSDPSDGNTNSTTLLSDDTDDKPKENTNQETSTSNHHDYASNPTVVEPDQHYSLEDLPGTTEDEYQTLSSGRMFSRPIKTNLKIAESSAFLAYVKSSAQTTTSFHNQIQRSADHLDSLEHRANCSSANERNDIVTGVNVGDAETFQMPVEHPVVCFSSTLQPEQSNEGHSDASGAPPLFHFPFYYPGMVEQGTQLSSVQNFQGNMTNAQAHVASTLLPQYNVYSQCHSVQMVPSFQYNPACMSLQSSHVGAPIVWSSTTSIPMPNEKSSRSERRAAALVKFRRKRKERCFDKKVRYVSRKKLAETRPRVRGQFVRQASNADLISAGDDNSEDDEDDGLTSRELEMVSSSE